MQGLNFEPYSFYMLRINKFYYLQILLHHPVVAPLYMLLFGTTCLFIFCQLSDHTLMIEKSTQNSNHCKRFCEYFQLFFWWKYIFQENHILNVYFFGGKISRYMFNSAYMVIDFSKLVQHTWLFKLHVYLVHKSNYV